MYTYNILVVDDEEEIRDAIEIYLTNQGYRVFKAENGLAALELIDKEKIHLVLLDIMMPRLDGTQTAMRIRQNYTMPIIMLSAKSEDMDKILGLNVGADDYITKPFNPLELLARVNSQLRRYTAYQVASVNDLVIQMGGLEINHESKEVHVDGELIRLTPLEYKILYLLMKNVGRVFSIEEIYENVWNEPAYNAETVTVHIRNIREKIEINPREPKYLKVVWGIGYKIERQD